LHTLPCPTERKTSGRGTIKLKIHEILTHIPYSTINLVYSCGSYVSLCMITYTMFFARQRICSDFYCYCWLVSKFHFAFSERASAPCGAALSMNKYHKCYYLEIQIIGRLFVVYKISNQKQDPALKLLTIFALNTHTCPINQPV